MESDPRPLGSDNVTSLEKPTGMRRAQTALEIVLAAVWQDHTWNLKAPGFQVPSTPEPVHMGPNL
jgi:hypothetical protein